MEHVDILCITESKLDSSFPESQFYVPGFKNPTRLDDSDRSGALMLYIRQSISSKALNCTAMSNDIQCVPIEINLKRQK